MTDKNEGDLHYRLTIGETAQRSIILFNKLLLPFLPSFHFSRVSDASPGEMETSGLLLQRV